MPESTKSVPVHAVKPEGARRRLRSHLAPPLALFFLAPFFGEYLLGNLKFSELFYVPFLAPLYGGGAMLIRETARRAGRGFATMLTLGVAYALFEEGLVDQMLFNRNYFAGQQEIEDTPIVALGIDVWLTVIVIAMHAVWSICIPILLVEALFRKRGTGPWLGRSGRIVVALIFVAGSACLGYGIYLEEQFLASVPQLIGTAVAIILLVTAAFKTGRRAEIPATGPVPKPWIAGLAAFMASSLFMLTDRLSGWGKAAACLLLAGAFFTAVYRWSRRQDWGDGHRFAMAGGGMLTYVWLGLAMEPETGPGNLIDQAGSVLMAVVALLLYAVAAVNMRKTGGDGKTPIP